MNETAPQPEVPQEKKMSVLGLLSTIFGGISMIPFLGFVSIPGLILGIIALVKKGGTLAIVGTVLSVVGLATSPILWGTVMCAVNAEACEEMSAEIQAEAEKQRLEQSAQ